MPAAHSTVHYISVAISFRRIDTVGWAAGGTSSL